MEQNNNMEQKKVEVETKTMGLVEVESDKIIEFPRGLFGFEEFHRYALVEAELHPFIWMQSLDDKSLSFLLIDPFLVADGYEIDVDDKTLLEIGVDSPADVVVYAIVTVPSDGGPVTANLQGPVVINRKNRSALQAILSDSKWTTKHNIVNALKSNAKV